MYTPVGFDPCRVSGETKGIDVRWLSEGKWLAVEAEHSGARVILRDKQGKTVGWFFIPSGATGRGMWEKGDRTLTVHTGKVFLGDTERPTP